jgi:hypothetical protein
VACRTTAWHQKRPEGRGEEGQALAVKPAAPAAKPASPDGADGSRKARLGGGDGGLPGGVQPAIPTSGVVADVIR